MNKDTVTEMLKDYRSYRYAAQNCRTNEGEYTGRMVPLSLNSNRLITAEEWDMNRYSRIVSMIDGAVNEVLSDDQRTVVMRKYLDRNTLTLNEIADVLHKDRSTVSRWHTEAIRRLSIALEPLSRDEREINNIDHMFEEGWSFRETA